MTGDDIDYVDTYGISSALSNPSEFMLRVSDAMTLTDSKIQSRTFLELNTGNPDRTSVV